MSINCIISPLEVNAPRLSGNWFQWVGAVSHRFYSLEASPKNTSLKRLLHYQKQKRGWGHRQADSKVQNTKFPSYVVHNYRKPMFYSRPDFFFFGLMIIQFSLRRESNNIELQGSCLFQTIQSNEMEYSLTQEFIDGKQSVQIPNQPLD